jgi:hypothetical protein
VAPTVSAAEVPAEEVTDAGGRMMAGGPSAFASFAKGVPKKKIPPIRNQRKTRKGICMVGFCWNKRSSAYADDEKRRIL